jgi:nucleoside-diphosphate-sugar epimerase
VLTESFLKSTYMQTKMLITGGSGFIGTNLIEYYIDKKFDVLNLDLVKPKIEERNVIWKKLDIRDLKQLKYAVLEYSPDYIIHLAARTDLDGKTLDDYSSNTLGTENLLKVIECLPNLKKVIITSSKFIAYNGYKIKNQFDYCPHTTYGESKVVSEKMVWHNQPHCDWCIIRPTSIWGPWFDKPYKQFFESVITGMYFHIGKNKCYKTYGYIGNSVHQIDLLLTNETINTESKVYYIGDYPFYEIHEWAEEISKEAGITRKIPTIPACVVKILAVLGDLLKNINIRIPMNTFRYKNMTNDGVNSIQFNINLPFSRIEGNRITLKWLMYCKQNISGQAKGEFHEIHYGAK